MSLLKMAIQVMFLLFVSTSGFPSHNIRGENALGSIRPGCGSFQLPGNSIPLPMTTTQAVPLPGATEEDEPSERIGRGIMDKLPPRPLDEGQEQLMPTVTRADILSPRLKRAVVWKVPVPKIRIPSITRLFKPKAKPNGGGPPSAPLPKAGPKLGPAPPSNHKAFPESRSSGTGTDSSLPGGKKSRQKGGSQSGESNSFPDFGDLPSFDDWDFRDSPKSDSLAGSSSENGNGTNSKEGDSKTTTEKTVKKGDDHHFHREQYSPDYDYHHD